MKVQVTVMVTHDARPGFPTVESRSLLIDSPVGAGRIVGDTARLVFEKAAYGHFLPTPKSEGGRG